MSRASFGWNKWRNPNDERMTNDEAERAIVLRILIIRISSFLRH
jgi:hypothetical protein